MLLFCLTGLSCKRDIKMTVKNFDMENTIMFGSKVESKNLPIERNCIVTIEHPLTKEIRNLRIIGLFGDKVEINNGEYYINDRR